ncbi:VCBS repeat-containing protein [Streptomyces sp. S.PB5]|uniref:FG-GAP repeat domain-containing protein n=1 Tax=Streptomyces sp. S.PB5 TaxID=3020844 RepID=UPI0025AF51CB|nr:VCBS repeat-containing protein [Streptomyces sp. S.PB5]MDN3023917.1 VCBS repeat-containing protein [Streptomyces sp. S.PB5]
MARHAFVRLLGASAILAAGLSPLLPFSAAADTAQETVVPATFRDQYTGASLTDYATTYGGDGTGSQGVFHRLEGHSGVVWTRYADGRTFNAPAPTGGSYVTRGTGDDVLAHLYTGGRVDLWNAGEGTTSTIQVPAGHTMASGIFGDTVVTFENITAEDGTTTRVTHLLSAAPDGSTRDVVVRGMPAGLKIGSPLRGDATGLLFTAGLEGTIRTVAVDPATGLVQSWTQPRPSGNPYVEISPDYLVHYAGRASSKVYVYSRADLSAAPVEVTLDNAEATYPASDLSVVGGWIVHQPAGRAAVTAVPIAGGDPVTLLPAANAGISASPSGNSVVIGRTGSDDWGIHRIHGDETGKPVVTLVKALPKPPYAIQGLALEQGRLLVADESWGSTRDTYVRTVAATGTPAFGARSSYDGTDVMLYDCPEQEGGCRIFGTADNRAVWLSDYSETSDRLVANGPAQYGYWAVNVPQGGRITDVSGQYLIHTTATQQIVLKLGDTSGPKVTRAPGAAALDGDVLWTAGATPGTVTAYNLSTKKTTETLTTDAGCTPTELQALGRYLYWTCDGKAGVYDRSTATSVPVPVGEAKLGDGYVVTHDKAAGKLVLTTVAGGTASGRVIGDLPDTGVSQRDVRWTVDEAGANAAYADDREQVHLVPSGVPQQPLRLLAPVTANPFVSASTIDTVPDTLATVLLSKPSSDWALTARNRATGKTYTDGRDGTAARGELTVGWHGADSTRTGDAFAPNGTYDWTLTVTPADGVGDPLTVKGTARLTKAEPVRHDHIGDDGIGDLLTLNSSGGLTFQHGTGKGTFAGKTTGAGWPTGARFVPVGDLSGDRCNDVLVRYSSGALRLYKPGCGAELTPSTAYTTLGSSGWTQYDVLTAPGDVNGDRLPDLIARNASTGAVYLYKGTGTGKLSARMKLYDNWKTYKKVVGAGDLNGDGVGDLLAQDKSNNLYRYYGKGNGTFTARAKVFSNWGGSYNVVVGVGDITGDGKADLVSRDTAGNLWRNNGNGKGSFGARTKIATGWQGYKGIF